MRVRLNLATKALETRRPFLFTAGILGVVAAIVFLSLGIHVWKIRRADAALRTQSDAVRQEMDSLNKEGLDLQRFFSQPENSRIHDRSVYLNTLIDERSFNWTRMFMDLEKILPAGVHVVSVEPKEEKGHIEVNLKVGASNDEAKLKFLKSIEDSHAFSHIKLLSEQLPTGQTNDHLLLELSATYSRI